ncbi:glycosyltransferase [Synechococcus sp. AH-551-N23]|nr:glycosyltransferase [Synechococcus sp. AH-551-N23]
MESIYDSVTIIVSPRERFSPIINSLKSLFDSIPSKVPVIVVEGGSPGNTTDELRDLKNSRQYILISKPHYLTPNEARNIGAKLATTKYVVFTDNDIVYSQNWLKYLLNNANQHESSMVSPITFIGPPTCAKIHHAGGNFKLSFSSDNIYINELHRLSNRLYTCESSINWHDEAPLKNEICEFHCVLVRKQLLESTGYLDERLITREHIDLALRAKCLGHEVTFEKNSHVTYLALNKFEFSDLSYFLYRWSNRLAKSSIVAFESSWPFKIPVRGLIRGSIGGRKCRAVGSCFPRLHKLLGRRLFSHIVVKPLEYILTKNSGKIPPNKKGLLCPIKINEHILDKMMSKILADSESNTQNPHNA